MRRRVITNSRFGATLDYERAPIIGAAAADRAHYRRIRQLLKVAACVALFWGGVAFALLWVR